MGNNGLYNILLVEDDPGEARLALEVLRECKNLKSVDLATDGIHALDYLYQRNQFKNVRRPDLIVLDLNLPKKDGRQVLADIKKNENLKQIPVVILTMSNNDEDIKTAYSLHANCYIIKTLDFDEYSNLLVSVVNFWFTVVTLPHLAF